MKLHVRYPEIESTPTLQRLIERRIAFGLSRFVHKVGRVRIAGPGLAVDGAIGRSARSIARSHDRRRLIAATSA